MSRKELFSWLVILLGAIGLPAGQSAAAEQDNLANQPQQVKIATSPDGLYYVEKDTGTGELSVVSGRDNSQHSRLQPVRLKVSLDSGDSQSTKELTSDQLESMPKAFFSPDSNWIFVGQLSDDDVSIGLLYTRSRGGQNENLRFELVSNERFDNSVFQFFADQEQIVKGRIILPARDIRDWQGIQFVAWSSDSARLLVTINAALDVPENSSFKNGITAWFCYFNTTTGNFELTERLRKTNLLFQSFDPWKPQSFIDRAPRDAEALGKEGPITPITVRFNQADGHLNETYGKLTSQLSPAPKDKLRQEERQWLITRDTKAVIYATQSWNPFPDAMILEGKASATEERVRELEKRLELGGSRAQSQ
jgi:uncharacterized protein YecT (DUF1311 family)